VSHSEPKTRLTNLRERRSDSRLVPTFTVLEGPEVGAFYAFDPGRRAHRVGRGEDADIRLNDASVSRVHAICVVASLEDRLTVRVSDNASTNGVLINGRKVEQASLISGDKVRLGDILLRFEWMAEEEVRYHSDVSDRVRAAERDPLSGLLTRAFLTERLPRLLEEVDRRGQPVSCLLLDLDHFKAINDVYGHLVGDQVIERVSEILLQTLRETDAAVRYGGEELLAFMPGLEIDDALQGAGRVAEAVREGSMFDLSPGLTVTASIGVAARGVGESWESWVERADRALYRAKQAGRDQVAVAVEPAPPDGAGEALFLETLPRNQSLGPITDDSLDHDGD